MRKIYIILSIIIVAIVLVFLTFRFMPAKYIIGLLGDDNVVSSLACSYPVKVAGDSMEPYFKSGEMAFFNKCFTEDDIVLNKTVVFKDNDEIRLGIIDRIENLSNGMTYKIIQSNRKDRISDVAKNQIIAIYKKEFNEQAQKETVEQSGKPTEIKTLDYSLILPLGWQTAKEDDAQSIFTYASEISETNFKTYFSVSKDQIQGNTPDDYINYLKNQIRESAPGIRFDNENNVKINGQDAFAMDGYVRQNNIDFRILIVVIEGNGDDLWVFNFNTIAGKWEDNAPVFVEILNSFNIK